MAHFTTIEIEPGPAGVQAALRAVHALFEEEQSVALVPTSNPAARAALMEGEPLHTDEPTLLLSTSGSLGRPRAVELTVSALAAAAMASAAYFRSEAVWLTALPVTGIGGLNTVIRSALAGVQPIAWQGEGSWSAAFLAANVEECVGWARRQGMSAATSLVPTQLHRIAEHPGGLDLLARLDYVLVGGGATPTDLGERAEGAGVRLVRTYGATESCGGVVYNGEALEGVELSISEAGEVLITSPTNATCYRDGNPIAPTWATGDRGMIASGMLQVLGRADEVVKVAGHKVDLAQLAAAVRELPDVAEVAVVAVDDAQYGKLPVVAYTGTAAAERVVAAALAHLGGARLPLRAKACAELPLLPNGKPDRQAIAAL